MKVTYQMIDKQIRIRGYIIDFFVRQKSEQKFHTFLRRVQKLASLVKGINVSGLDCSEEWLTRKDGSQLRILIYRSKKKGAASKNLPGVLWLHGGGYALSIPEMYVARYRRLIKTRNCVVVAPDYRLSTEAPYPAALEDAYLTLVWMKEHAKALGIRNDQLMVGGESAGGGLTTALTLYARDQGTVKIAFQMPVYPMIDDRMITESARDNNVPIWNSKTNRWAWDLYLRDMDKHNLPPYAAAARAKNYQGLPPAVTFVGNVDVFRDETIEWVERMREAGVPVDFLLLDGCYHGFDITSPRAEVSKKALEFLSESFAKAVDQYVVAQETK